mmetsp:Transcript_26099/g.54676  ORF Transcript_26099/g.54676 Transcript_26099/m.54676 type:complete len:185 (-) Transcript_26099:2514-3068(-)
MAPRVRFVFSSESQASVSVMIAKRGRWVVVAAGKNESGFTTPAVASASLPTRAEECPNLVVGSRPPPRQQRNRRPSRLRLRRRNDDGDEDTGEEIFHERQGWGPIHPPQTKSSSKRVLVVAECFCVRVRVRVFIRVCILFCHDPPVFHPNRRLNVDSNNTDWVVDCSCSLLFLLLTKCPSLVSL